jgi:hypothetical protein
MQSATQFAQQMLGRQKERYTQVVEGLPAEALDWRPGDATTNSVAQIVRHVHEGLPWLLGMALGEGGSASPEERQKRHEHSLRNDPATQDELLSIINAGYARADELLTRLDALDLSEEVSPFGRPTERFFYVGLVVAHGAEHIGHAELTKQLWEQRDA